eukprot:Pgem_evm1s3053
MSNSHIKNCLPSENYKDLTIPFSIEKLQSAHSLFVIDGCHTNYDVWQFKIRFVIKSISDTEANYNGDDGIETEMLIIEEEISEEAKNLIVNNILQRISTLTNLKTLVLDGNGGHLHCGNFNFLIPLSNNLTTLKLYYFSHRDLTTNNLQFLKKFYKLEKLVIAGAFELDTLEMLQNCLLLKELELAAGPDLLDLSTIGKVQETLEHLDVTDIYTLTTFDSLKNFKSLQTLIFRRLENLIDITALSSLTNLTKLSLYSGDKLTDYSIISNLCNLQELNL